MLKYEITQKILQLNGVDPTQDRIRKTIPSWWFSTRNKTHGGLRLTDQGYEAFLKAEIKEYSVKFMESFEYTNQLIIWLDKFIDCPFYLGKDEIIVFSEKMAVQLVLFSGNIYKYSAAKAKSLSS